MPRSWNLSQTEREREREREGERVTQEIVDGELPLLGIRAWGR